jgi:ABC-type branched-subunit amino acid transport system permease subunit
MKWLAIAVMWLTVAAIALGLAITLGIEGRVQVGVVAFAGLIAAAIVTALAFDEESPSVADTPDTRKEDR